MPLCKSSVCVRHEFSAPALCIHANHMHEFSALMDEFSAS